MTKREKTIAFIVGGAVGLFALDQVLLSPLLDRLTTADKKIEDHRRALSTSNDVLQKRLAASKAWKPLAGDRVKADSSAAESQLRERVLDCGRRANVAVPTYQSDKTEREQGYDRSQLTVTATGGMRQIARFLYELQFTDVPLRIESAQLKSRVDATDDLSLQVKLSTIYQAAPGQKVAMLDTATGDYR